MTLSKTVSTGLRMKQGMIGTHVTGMLVASFVWDLGRSVSNLLWMEEILHQLVDGLSRYNPINYSVITYLITVFHSYL